jgi:ssDNA-binding Zn-finger/Zn-ribbon topoisomerase 1
MLCPKCGEPMDRTYYEEYAEGWETDNERFSCEPVDEEYSLPWNCTNCGHREWRTESERLRFNGWLKRMSKHVGEPILVGEHILTIFRNGDEDVFCPVCGYAEKFSTPDAKHADVNVCTGCKAKYVVLEPAMLLKLGSDSVYHPGKE